MQLNVGCRILEAPDPIAGAAVPIRLLYPTLSPPQAERFGAYTLDVALDAPVAAPEMPLVVVSHGDGGTSLTHRALAAHLANAGFAVALVDHPGNRAGDNTLSHSAANLENRPRHVSLALDAVFADPRIGACLKPEVGMIGHSIGGYTALAVAGGRPMAGAHNTADGAPATVAVTPDPRVKALVLLAPATPWFMAPGALAGVSVPILMMTGDSDPITPQMHGRIVAEGVADPVRLDHRVIVGAGHFAFQSSPPEAMRTLDFAPAHDPPGFDRATFHVTMHAVIEAFLRKALS